MCSENLRAALTQIAEARRVFQNNSIMSFVPLGLQQMLQVLQGHEVCLLLAASLYSRVELGALWVDYFP